MKPLPVILFIVALLVLLASCCPLVNTYDCSKVPVVPPPQPPETYTPPEAVEPTETEEPDNFVLIELDKAKVSTQDSVKTYDFNLRTENGFTIYGLGAINEGKLVILLKSQTQLLHIVWEKEGGETENFYPEFGPPEDLEMEIEGAPGENFWFILPFDASQEGQIKVFYD